MAALNANSNPAYLTIQAFLGPADESHVTAIDFDSSSLTGAAVISHPVNLPNNATTTVSLASLFASALSPQFFCIYDTTTTPGQNFGVSFNGAGGPFNFVAAGSPFAYACDGTALPANVYLNNPNATAGVVVIAVITN